MMSSDGPLTSTNEPDGLIDCYLLLTMKSGVMKTLLDSNTSFKAKRKAAVSDFPCGCSEVSGVWTRRLRIDKKLNLHSVPSSTI
jgi:hypothetical protein